MLRRSIVSLSLGAVLCTLAQAGPTSIGPLGPDDQENQLVGTHAWGSYRVTLQGTEAQGVDFRPPASVFRRDDAQSCLGHQFLETLPGLLPGDLRNIVDGIIPAGPAGHRQSGGLSKLPDSICGIRLEGPPALGSSGVVVRLDAMRAPLWSNLCLKSGTQGDPLSNAGPARTDSDPANPVDSDAVSGPQPNLALQSSMVPAPGVVILGSLAAGLVSWRRRRLAL